MIFKFTQQQVNCQVSLNARRYKNRAGFEDLKHPLLLREDLAHENHGTLLKRGKKQLRLERQAIIQIALTLHKLTEVCQTNQFLVRPATVGLLV